MGEHTQTQNRLRERKNLERTPGISDKIGITFLLGDYAGWLSGADTHTAKPKKGGWTRNTLILFAYYIILMYSILLAWAI